MGRQLSFLTNSDVFGKVRHSKYVGQIVRAWYVGTMRKRQLVFKMEAFPWGHDANKYVIGDISFVKNSFLYQESN